MSDEIIRSFIAIDIASQETLNEILTFQKMLLDTRADLKPVKGENIHITLRFLGEISSKLVVKISEEFKSLSFNPFEVSLQGVGVFPNMKRINVVWVGINRGHLELVGVYSQVERILKKLGIPLNNRGFNPHITIVRVRSAKNKDGLEKALMIMKNRKFGVFSVNTVKLKKSELTPNGPLYTTLAESKAINM